MRKIVAVLIVLLMIAAPAIADTIYIWTDKDGVKRFSNQPPEGVEEYETVQGSISKPEEQARPGLEKMIKDVEQENLQSDAQKEQEAALRKAEKERKAMEEKNARIQAERSRLQKQIDELNNRALSPTFTQGMRDNQIKMIQEKIDALQ